jgi:hypothetical protein
MNKQIGEAAGIVWQFLHEHTGATPEQIRKELKIEERLLNLSLGWLAREGKVLFEPHEKTVKLSVVSE